MRNIARQNFSSHAERRIMQRNIPKEIIFLALDEGKRLDRNKDRIILTKKRVKELFNDDFYSHNFLLKAEKCAPVVVVENGGEIATVFRPTRGVNRKLHIRRAA